MHNKQHLKKNIIPLPLKPGDQLQVIAPSGVLREMEAFEEGVEIWRSRGYQVKIIPEIVDKWGYLAGKDENRRRQLAMAWKDPECRGILCVRGGYGSTRLLENWTWGGEDEADGQKDKDGKEKYSLTPHSPQTNATYSTQGDTRNAVAPPYLPQTKWLIGFSDITALLWSLYNVGISGVHAPVLTTLAAEPDWSQQRLFDWVEGRSLPPLQGFGWGGGVVNGTLLPGNLTVATHLLGTPLQPNFDNVILALEDVTEAPYRIDRLLTQWRMSGALQNVRGIALGRFSRCESPPKIPSFTIEEVLRDRLGDLDIPIVSNLPFGHDGANAALPVGMTVTLDAEQGILDITP